MNHNGKPRLARRLVDAAAKARVNAVKFQVFRSTELVTRWAPKADYQKSRSGDTTHMEMLENLELGIETFANLKERCERRGVEFLGTPFDLGSARDLQSIGVRAFKIGSGDLTHLPLISAVAGFGRPVILSTGMGTLAEVKRAVGAVSSQGASELCLLHCTTQYPARPDEVNLRAMNKLQETFKCPVGYSDHTLIQYMPLLAVAAGASLIEKHLTLSRELDGPDHRSSLEPAEFHQLVTDLRLVESILGDAQKRPSESELGMRRISRRSIVARERIHVGERISMDNVAFKRPGTGIPPSQLAKLLGKRAGREIEADELIRLEDVKDSEVGTMKRHGHKGDGTADGPSRYHLHRS